MMTVNNGITGFVCYLAGMTDWRPTGTRRTRHSWGLPTIPTT